MLNFIQHMFSHGEERKSYMHARGFTDPVNITLARNKDRQSKSSHSEPPSYRFLYSHEKVLTRFSDTGEHRAFSSAVEPCLAMSYLIRSLNISLGLERLGSS